MKLLREESAAVAPMVAILAPMLIATAGFALDTTVYYVGNRDLRAATEAATLAAAQDPYNAEARARDYLALNGFDGDVIQSVEVGRYCPDINLSAGARFDTSYTLCPGNGQATAVRITTEKESRQYLTKLLGPMNPIPALSATATAARIDEAGIGVTSGLLTVTNSLVVAVNELLGAILGIKLRLTTADVEALLGGNIDAGLFFDALAESSGETGTYGELVNNSVPLSDLLLAAAIATDDGTASILTGIARQVDIGYQVPLSGLFDLGVWENLPVGEADEHPSLRAGLNAYQLFAFAVQSGSGTIDLSDAVSLAVPGSTVRVAAVATGPLDRARFSFGPEGETIAGTSALRLQVLLGIGDISLLGDTVSVDSVPVIVDIAAATAEIVDIECTSTGNQSEDTRVTVRANSGLVNAYIGEAPANAMQSPMPILSAADIEQARLANVAGLVTVDARAVAQPVFGTSNNVVFGLGGQGTIGKPPVPGTPVTSGNTAQAGPLISTLGDSLLAEDGLQVKVLGLCLPIVCSATQQAVRNQLVGNVTTALGGLVGSTADPLLDNLLAALGIQLGHVTVWTTGARCGVPVLV